MTQTSQLFRVDVAGGHVPGYIRFTCPVRAMNKKEASDKVIGKNGYTKRPRVLINPKTGKAIVFSVTAISLEKYIEIQNQNKSNGYLNSHSIQEQRALYPDIEDEVIRLNDRYADLYGDNGKYHRNLITE